MNKLWSDEILRLYVESMRFERTIPESTPWTRFKYRTTWYLWRKWKYRLEDWIHRDCER